MFARSERLEILRLALEREQAQQGAIDLVVIDGVADLCKSPNDEAEALELVSKLHARGSASEHLNLSYLGIIDRVRAAMPEAAITTDITTTITIATVPSMASPSIALPINRAAFRRNNKPSSTSKTAVSEKRRRLPRITPANGGTR